MALGSILIFGVLVLGSFLAAVFVDAEHWKSVHDALGILIGPVGTLVGSVTGFYFGERTAGQRG